MVRLLGRLSLSLLSDERLVDVGDDTSSGDGGLDEGVQLLVTSDGQLQVAGGDTLHLQVLGSVSGQLENLKNKLKLKIKSTLVSLYFNLLLESSLRYSV